jgi:hypothetical protein
VQVRVVRYLTGIPRKPLAPGQVVVHNPNARASRITVVEPIDAEPSAAGREYRDTEHTVVPCDCGWAPELGEHYRHAQRD